MNIYFRFRPFQFVNLGRNIKSKLYYCSSTSSLPISNVPVAGYSPVTSIFNQNKLTLLDLKRVSSTTNYRLFSSESEEPSPKSGPRTLMDFPLIVWPSILTSIRNWILVFFIIKPRFESDFSLTSFALASKHALVKVSEILSKGDFTGLAEFVEENALNEIKKNYSLLNFKERLDLAADADDVFFFFPYQIGLIFKKMNDERTERVFLEITMCYHMFKGLKDFIETSKKSTTPQNMYDDNDRIIIANYRFIKEVTKGTEDQWTINILNHFKPHDLAVKF